MKTAEGRKSREHMVQDINIENSREVNITQVNGDMLVHLASPAEEEKPIDKLFELAKRQDKQLREHLLTEKEGYDPEKYIPPIIKAEKRLSLNAPEGIRPERDSFRADIQSSSKFAGKVILACRTHYFRDMEDVDSQVSGARKTGFRRQDFQIGFLNNFTSDQILAYLRKCFGKDKAEELWNTLKGIYNIPDLAKRPFLLSLIEEHVNEVIELKQKGIDITSASLYELTIREWIKRDREREKLLSGAMKAECMEDLALNLWKKQTQSEGINEIDEWVRKNILPKFSGITAGAFVELQNDIRTATFLNWSGEEGEKGKGIFCFQHRSFQEFFIARKIARFLSCNDPAPMAIPGISNETAEFVLGLLQSGESREYNPQQSSKTIERVLEEAYTPQVSENALILLLKWKELFPDSYPLPMKFCLSGANLYGFIFKSLDMQDSLFDEAELEGARFNDCDLSRSNFSGARMKEARFRSVIAHSTTARGAICPGLVWEGVQAEGCTFAGADLTSATFLDSGLTGADFESAGLRFAAFTGTDLSKANLNAKTLEHTGIAGCTLKDIFCPVDRLRESILIMPHDSSLPPSHQIKDLLPRLLPGHTNSIASVAISADAGLIASGSDDNTIKLWELKDVGWVEGNETHQTPLIIHPLPEEEYTAIRNDKIISINAERYAALSINLTNFPARALAGMDQT